MPDDKKLRQPQAEKQPARVERLPNPAEDEAESRLVITGEFHTGALPHPEFWERYEKAVPGTGLRLLRLVEEEQQQRWAFRRRGQWFGIVTAICFGGAAAWLIDRNRDVAGFAFVIAAITPIVGGFLGRILRAVETKVLKKLDVEEDESP